MGRGPNPLKRQSLENPKPPRPRASTVGFAKKLLCKYLRGVEQIRIYTPEIWQIDTRNGNFSKRRYIVQSVILGTKMLVFRGCKIAILNVIMLGEDHQLILDWYPKDKTIWGNTLDESNTFIC